MELRQEDGSWNEWLSGGRRDPDISVVIPTYNRRELLLGTLRSLVRQRFQVGEYEVVVSDDGSTDDTRDLVASFADELAIGCHYQPDLGFRLSKARNSGARLARAPLVAFLDSGVLVGPDWLTHHYQEHARSSASRVLMGYAYGYNPPSPMPGIREALDVMPPEDVVSRFRNVPAFRDVRHPAFEACDFELSRRLAPWVLLFPLNCSVPADVFWQVGGFYEEFQRWSLEDLELGYRLHKAGVEFEVSCDAWALEYPHERNEGANWESLRLNIEVFLARHPDPVIELGWGLIRRKLLWQWEAELRRLASWRERSRDLDVSAEITEAMSQVPQDARVAIIGAGATVPKPLTSVILVDYDEDALSRSSTDHARPGHHAVGLNTLLPDGCVDRVILTSRLRGLWPMWRDEFLAEALRLGSGAPPLVSERSMK